MHLKWVLLTMSLPSIQYRSDKIYNAFAIYMGANTPCAVFRCHRHTLAYSCEKVLYTPVS